MKPIQPTGDQPTDAELKRNLRALLDAAARDGKSREEIAALVVEFANEWCFERPPDIDG